MLSTFSLITSSNSALSDDTSNDIFAFSIILDIIQEPGLLIRVFKDASILPKILKIWH